MKKATTTPNIKYRRTDNSMGYLAPPPPVTFDTNFLNRTLAPPCYSWHKKCTRKRKRDQTNLLFTFDLYVHSPSILFK